MEITNLLTGETVCDSSIEGFSSKRLLVANFNNAEELLRSMLKRFRNNKISLNSYHILIQQLEMIEGGLSEVEIRALRDTSEQAGGVKVKVLEHNRILSNEEALFEIQNSK